MWYVLEKTTVFVTNDEGIPESQYVTEPVAVTDIPANTQRDTHVIITSKRRFDVINTCILRFVFAEMMIASFKFKLIRPWGEAKLNPFNYSKVIRISAKWVLVRDLFSSCKIENWPICFSTDLCNNKRFIDSRKCKMITWRNYWSWLICF